MVKISQFRAITFCCCLIICATVDFNDFDLNRTRVLNNVVSLINHSTKILCTFDATNIYVYFENNTSLGYPGYILRKLKDCGTSYIVLRNKYKKEPLEAVDDGVLMYLVLMVKNASQQIDLSVVKKKSASKHRSFFIVIVEDSTDLDELWLRTTFEKFWKIWVLNAIILFWRDNDIQKYTYSPFTEKFLWKLNSNATARNDLFFRSKPNMDGQKLRMCLFPDETRAIFEPTGKIIGADGYMAEFIADRLNATIVVRSLEQFQFTKSFQTGNVESADSCLEEIRTASSDMAMNTRFLSYDNFKKNVEHSLVYGRDDLCVLVPKAKAASLFWNLFRSFQIPVWIVICSTFLVAYGFCRILLPQMNQTFLKLYSTMLTQPLCETPPNISVKIFLMFWFSYCLLITAAYKCNLTSNLVFRISLPEVDSLADLANSQYELLIHARHMKFIDKFLDSSVSHLNQLKKKILPVTDDFFMRKLNKNDLSYAYLEKYHLLSYRVSSKNHYRNGRPLFHFMKACPVPFQTVYVVPYGSPYLGFLNNLVRQAQEHGFVHHWEKIMDSQFMHSGKSVVRNIQNDDDPVVLKLSHLQASFVILGLGLTTATIVLFCEIYQAYGIGLFIYHRQNWNEEHFWVTGQCITERRTCLNTR